VAAILLLVLLLGSFMLLTNSAQVERHYDRDPGRVFEAVRALARDQPRWTEVAADPNALRLAYEARTRVFGFVDDVTLTVVSDAHGGSRLVAGSASRIGKSDFGTNGRRLAGFVVALDERLRAPVAPAESRS
jgi:uncharacterized protein (DUF1499 family)